MKEALKAATWRSNSVFVSFYLSDVAYAGLTVGRDLRSRYVGSGDQFSLSGFLRLFHKPDSLR